MWTVVAALVPAGFWSGYVFGYRAWLVILTAVVFCVGSEAAVCAIRKLPLSIGDGSAVVTGMLLAFVLPASAPVYVTALGGVIAIVLVKQIFGGLGHNIWNPALMSRAILQLSFPNALNLPEWPILKGSWKVVDVARFAGNINDLAVDAVTRATPLTMLPQTGIEQGYSPADFGMWMGLRPGCLGETCFVLLALGCVALIALRIVKWYVPVVYLGTLALMVTVLPYGKGEGLRALTTSWGQWGNPFYHVVFGGAALGAMYMATDMVTTPLTRGGQLIFAVGCGVITALVRLYGGYPEGVCYSILLMNTATPLIDRVTRPRVFGTVWPSGRPGKGVNG